MLQKPESNSKRLLLNTTKLQEIPKNRYKSNFGVQASIWVEKLPAQGKCVGTRSWEQTPFLFPVRLLLLARVSR